MVIFIKGFRFSARTRNRLRSNTEDTELLRSELFSIEQLKRHVVTLAGQHKIDPSPGPDKLLPRLSENANVLLAAYDVVKAIVDPASGQRIVPAEAWLLDNFYLIKQQIDLAQCHLPRGYSRQLPQLLDGASAGFPRIYDLALELISHMDGRVDSDNATHTIVAYQTVSPLKLGELWAFPIMLQLALLENLRRVGLRIARQRQERDAAVIWADRMLATAKREPKQLIQLLAEFANADVPLTAPFVEEFYTRLQVQGSSMSFVQTWVEQKLLEQGVTATQLSEAASRIGATNQISVANSIASLRFIGAMDWRNYVESLSVVEQVLREDPTGMYATQDFATRDWYRHVVEDLARACSCSELVVAREAITLAQSAVKELRSNDRATHVGYYLIDRGRPMLERSLGRSLVCRFWFCRMHPHLQLALYISPILSLVVLGILATLSSFDGLELVGWRYWFFVMVGMIAFSAPTVSLVNLVVTFLLSPRALPRLDFSQGIPAAHRTMVVVPTLISQSREVDDLLEALEVRYLGNRDPNVFFALLTDFHDASEQSMPGDDTLLMHARAAVQALNEMYCEDRPCIFYLFHRARTWNPYEQIWMGYERKRGKLEQFNALLRGEEQSAFSDIVGDPAIFASIKYIITLDTDTQLPRNTAQALVGNMAHPLNRPVYDIAKGRIVEGYAILQPRASISLTSANQSRFAKLFAGDTGIDPYTREVSDVYQDIFGEGSFIGKGIYDLDAFRQAVDKRFPENLILSHDLLESGYARSALVTDVDLIEEHPASYVAETSRRHRWIRGDWQIAGWLFSRVPGCPQSSRLPGSDEVSTVKTKRQPNQLSALLVWKIFDNLRRSLVPPSLLAILIGGWLLGEGLAWFWSLLIFGLLLLPIVLAALLELSRKSEECNWVMHLLQVSKSTGSPIVLALLTLVFLPYDAWICLDAIGCSGIRKLFSRRGLLLWHTSSYAKRNACRTLVDFFKEMWVTPAVALAIGLVLIPFWESEGGKPLELLPWAPILLAWLASPAIAWWISKPLLTPVPDLTMDQKIFLRGSARRTWRFFADFVGVQDNWLPPDNFQEYPVPTIASRTSPTNVGMSLLANLAAYDFGYIPAGELLRLTENTFATMERLERYRGHFYNWYDTHTLKPLHPQYISSVDSGNLAGSLLTLQAALVELQSQPILSLTVFQGLQDTLLVLVDHLPSLPAPNLEKKIDLLQGTLSSIIDRGPELPLISMGDWLEQISGMTKELVAELPVDINVGGELYYWAQALDQQVRAFQNELKFLMPKLEDSSGVPTLLELSKNLPTDTEIQPSTGFSAASVAHFQGVVDRLRMLRHLESRCHELAAMDFEFLYDTSSGLLSIGYDVGERRRDPSCYDLLASEARLASFLTIAQGQVPQKHWFSLGRQLTNYGGNVSLISWSGSMFEYLMPELIMRNYQNTLLEETCKAVVSRQIEYGRQRGVPWGISESCYNATDMHQIYQYRAFGVPGLGFKRGLGDDLVVAPYASALALIVKPSEACNNLQKMAASGFLGNYGFYESIDYTLSRVPRGKNHAVVRTFMAHHQGMSLLAFDHVLSDQPMQRRFMSLPQIRATELLLQERIPKKGGRLYPHATEVNSLARTIITETGSIMRVFTDPNTPIPEVHLLSNGRYHVMATNAGGGYSHWRGLAVTRWREDTTSDGWGTFVYLRDPETGYFWSTAYQPTLRKADYYEAIFVQGRAEYRRRDQAIETHTEISVSPEDDVEIRRVTLTNLSSRDRLVEITSYAEVVLAPLNADLAHRAFSNLFIQTEILPERQAILCTRRHRTVDEPSLWMFHLFAAPGVAVGEPSYETDRSKFIGRGRTVVNPVAMDKRNSASILSNTDGSVLDPIVAIRRTMSLSSDESATIQIISGVADTREEALALVEKYCDRHFVERAFEMAWFQSQEVLRHLNATEADAQIYGRLASSIIYSNALHRALPNIISRNQLGQSGLWRFALSGDLPIVLIRIGSLNRIDLLKQVLQAHAYWRLKGLVVDLVIVNEDFSSYRATLQDQIVGLINAGPDAQSMDKPGGVFVRRAEELSEDDRVLFQTVARVVVVDTVETLADQVERRMPAERVLEQLVPSLKQSTEIPRPLATGERIFSNGLGGFTSDGREYVIALEAGQITPAPWVNVIASPYIGTVVSESGGAYTWVENAHEFRLTPWHNDPLTDSSGEALYLRDEETGMFWSPTPLPAPAAYRGRPGYVCRHGFGYSVFEHEEFGISSELVTYVAMNAAVKFAVVKLHNQSKRMRRLSLTGYWELVLGEWRHSNMMHIVTETDPLTGALFARNAYGRECANRIVFAQVSEREYTMTGSRTEFVGRNGTLANPAAMSRKRLSGKTGAGFDPAAAIQTKIDLAEGQIREIVFIFGAARGVDEARDFIRQFSGPAGALQALEVVHGHWKHTLSAIKVTTPDPALDVLANGWLVYQILSCRLWGRSGYYQSGGAYGFRDQLQDTMALIHATPSLAREHLLRCAERQFRQGDVQHWWHPPNGQGVRTHFSDDYLWLPYATCRYVLATGDTGVLEESAHFLEGRSVNSEEEAYYDQPQRSVEVATLYEHCVRAIKHALRFGEHGLPLMGSGDWNDGMNLVGHGGRGESVWLGWFLYDNLQRFAGLAHSRGDQAFAEICTKQALLLRSNIEANAWDGGWYRRAYFDDGTPLGSSGNEECQIDSISQSWAIISGGGDVERASQAMAAVDQRLVLRDAQLIKLLAPPFDRSNLEPGYIKGYVPGVRENGGQYTHAAIWTVMAFAMMGDKERAWEFMTMLNPVNHTRTPDGIACYQVEPYVMSADIYAAEPHTGRGGWTWYTGAAGWMYRLIVETLLGLQVEGKYLRITPCMPAHWQSYKMDYRYRNTVYHITVHGVDAALERSFRVTLDGVLIGESGVEKPETVRGMIPLTDDHQDHYVDVHL